jgi:hypothetical protein
LTSIAEIISLFSLSETREERVPIEQLQGKLIQIRKDHAIVSPTIASERGNGRRMVLNEYMIQENKEPHVSLGNTTVISSQIANLVIFLFN